MAREPSQHEDNATSNGNAEIFALAVGWASTELTAIWARYTAFLVALTIVMAAIAAAGTSETFNAEMRYVLIPIAILACILWGYTHYKGYKNFENKIIFANRIYSGPEGCNPLPNDHDIIFDEIWYASVFMIGFMMALIICLLFV